MHTKDALSGSLDPLRERALVIAAQASHRAWQAAPHRRWHCVAWNELFRRHQRTIWKQVRAFASKASAHGIETDDLYAEFCLAFFRTIIQFDYTRSTRIITPFVWEVKRQYLDAKRRSDSRGLQLPEHIVVPLGRIHHAERLHRMRHGDNPTDAQVAAATGLPIDHVALWRSWAGRYVSLDAPIFGGSDITLHEVLANHPSDDPFVTEDRIRELSSALSTLSPRDQLVLTARYLEEEGLALKDIGARIGVTSERVRVLVNNALPRLRRAVLYSRHPARTHAPSKRA